MRIWITGVGVTCSLGHSAEEAFTRIVAGERGLSVIDLFDTSDQRASLGAQVRGIEVPDDPRWSRATAFAHRAAREAMQQARLDPRGARVGLIVGGTTAGMFENELRVAAMIAGKAPLDAHPALRSHPLSSTGDVLDAELGPFQRMRTVASACSSGVTALTLALAWLARGDVDAVVAGGTDALCRLTLSGFNALAAIDPEPCRPFDKQRRGLNLGEGAGFFVLEPAERVRVRGATPLAELAGASLAAEAHHITNPDSEGRTAARVMREALERANVAPADVDYINAHGTGTPLNDAMEAKAITQVLGRETERVWVSSSKAQIGHTLAAAGAIEAVIAALSVQRRVLPPTVGLAQPDPACALRHVTSAQRMDRVRAVVSSSFGFGGMDGAVVITEPELAPEPRPARHRVSVSAARALRDGEALSLDAAKARRLDRAARLCAAVAHDVAGKLERPRESCGVVLGSAFSSVDEAATFVERILSKGPRLASPADFPNLVPSSPIGHASIYEGLRGPALATADVGVSGESAVATAIELIETGYAEAFVAGGVSVRSKLVDQVFASLFGTQPAGRTEHCAAVLLERARDEKGFAIELRVARSAVALDLPTPRAKGRAYGAAPEPETSGLLAGTPWAGVPVASVSEEVGSNEAAGASALAAAFRALDAREIEQALVVGARENVVYAFLLTCPPRS